MCTPHVLHGKTQALPQQTWTPGAPEPILRSSDVLFGFNLSISGYLLVLLPNKSSFHIYFVFFLSLLAMKAYKEELNH